MRASTLLVHVPLLCLVSLVSTAAADLRTGATDFGDWQTDAPGVRRHIRASDLPAPKTGTDDETPEFRSNAKVAEPPPSAAEGPGGLRGTDVR